MKESLSRIGYRIVTEIKRIDPKILELLRQYDTTLLADGANSRVAMEPTIKPITPGTKIVGNAITLKLTLGDSLLVSKALDIAQPGDVVVIDGAGTESNALWGDLKSLIGRQKSLEGAVIDGAIRDIVSCRKIGFPVFCKYIVCGSSTKNSPGEINIPIVCGKVVVNPGDIVVGDDNGVVVLSKDRIEEIIQNAERKRETVESIRQDILKGNYVTKDFSRKMRELGYEV